MRVTKQYLYAIKLPEEKGYIYFTLIAGNQMMGYMLEVYDYVSKEIEFNNIEHISIQNSLFKTKYILGYFQSLDKNTLTKVGKVNLDYKNKSYEIYEKFSIECTQKKLFTLLDKINLRDDYSDDEYHKSIKELAIQGEKIICDNWEIYTYGTNKTGKFNYTGEKKIGMLSEKYKDSHLFGTAYLIEDIVEYYMTGIDRITAEILIHQ
jgi:hypothetical protein